MLYPVYVHLGDSGHAHGVTMPDFPGCFSAADDWQDLPHMVQEAVEVWCVGEDLELPDPTALEKLASNGEFSGGVWMLIEIDVTKLDTRANQRPVRINVSMPVALLYEIDNAARSQGATRSGMQA
jgi:predicted RNase H-like HicB family nuclease